MTFQEKVLTRVRVERHDRITNRFAAGVLLAIVLIWGNVLAHDLYLLHKPPQVVSTDDKSAAPDPPPTDITVNGERWQIYSFSYDRRPDIDKFRMGQTVCASRDIFYDGSRIPTKAMLRETIWHEVVHAAHCKSGKTDGANWGLFTHDSPEHASVYELGMFLPGFVHDNPEFMKWAEEWK